MPLRAPRTAASRVFAFGFAFAATFMSRSESRAQGTQDPAAAAFLFKEGRKAIEAKDFATACPKFAESFRLDPAPGTLLNLASCEEQLGHTASAWQAYQQAAERLPKGDDRIPIAKERAAALEGKLPRLSVKLAKGAPPGTRVTRDGVELGAASLGALLPVNPGPHTLVVTAEGREPRTLEISVAGGESKSLALEVGAEQAAKRAPALVSPPPPSSVGPRPPERETGEQPPAPFPRRTVGFVAGGVGVVGLVTAGITGGLLLSKRSTVRGECDAQKACSAAGVSAAETGKTLVPINAAAWIVGVVGVGAGAYLVLSGGGKEPPKTIITASADSHGGGAFVKGQF